MFKDDATKTTKNIETIIGPSVKVEGDFSGDGDVIVEGIVSGNLKTKNHLKVMQGAKIQAEIEAKSAFIAGDIIGNINVADDLELTASAKIKGDISANIISVERGAVLNGKITMGGALPNQTDKKRLTKEEE